MTQMYESEKEHNPIVYMLGSHESLELQQSMAVAGFMVGDIPCHQWPPNDELSNPLKPLEIRSNLQSSMNGETLRTANLGHVQNELRTIHDLASHRVITLDLC
ncbi:uncharacterized protein N7525_005669 [Penicillium rubens]|uniref:uncharacterized protein n=1 Tax=Penicillium rubens TaxID=1108849 RepID=UPI002A5A7F45|nr:uncharacterized protein N7525_005669 [Penicillium rubens]KAJ5840481.1 hypothetical protein N7525_005669 [Penicillium rubens]KAJ5868459.1 hypothetical protein N7534_003012 [Penicillium rubens]